MRWQRELLVDHRARQRFVEQDPAARDDRALAGELAVPRDEVMLRNAVAVEKDQVVAACFRNALVADFGQAKAVVRMPDMLDAHRTRLRAALDRFARWVARTVVGDDDFVVRIGLCRAAGQYAFERIGPVVGADDHGDQHVAPAVHGLLAPCRASSSSISFR
jgi:hypothetical protein